MQKTKESLLRILSEALWHNSPGYSHTGSEWEEILDLAQEHGVLYLLLQECGSLPSEISSTSWPVWRRKLIATMLNNESLLSVQSALLKLLAAQGIPCAILKGTSLSAYYDNPSARALGDIDLLVPPQYADQAAEILISQGFHAPEESYIHPYHIDFYRKKTIVELHFAASTFPDSPAGNMAKRYMDSCWHDIQYKHIADHSFPCLSDLHQALQLLLHMERHMTTGCIGLRQLCDWAVFVKRVSPDYFAGQILPILSRCGLGEFARVLTKTSIQYLGLGPDHGAWCSQVSAKHTEAMMQEILRTGSIHNKDNNDDISSFFVESSGSEAAFRVFIRKISVVCRKRFPITRKYPVLLPIFWVYVPLRYWSRSLLGKRHQKSISHTVRLVKQRKQLYKQLQLFKIDQ